MSDGFGIWTYLPLVFIAIVAVGWAVYLNQKNSSASSLPSSGPLQCPFCQHLLHEHVEYLAQQVTCPACHAAFRAPHKDGPAGDPDVAKQKQEAANAAIGVLSGIAMLVFAYWLFTIAGE